MVACVFPGRSTEVISESSSVLFLFCLSLPVNWYSLRNKCLLPIPTETECLCVENRETWFPKLLRFSRRKGGGEANSLLPVFGRCVVLFLSLALPGYTLHGTASFLFPSQSTLPLFFCPFVAIWQIHVDTANIHLFRHIMSRNREQLELCLLLLLMRMGKRGRERESEGEII